MFSQYPRPSDYPQENSDLPSLKDIRIMGYAMRTKAYRFVEWVAFNHTSYEADFDEVCMQFRSNWLFRFLLTLIHWYVVCDMDEL